MRSFSAKSRLRSASLRRASGGTGNTPCRSRREMGSVRIGLPNSIARYNPEVLQSADVLRLVDRFMPGDDGEAEKSRDLILALLSFSPEPFSRYTYTPGHITCTGVVLS